MRDAIMKVRPNNMV